MNQVTTAHHYEGLPFYCVLYIFITGTITYLLL